MLDWLGEVEWAAWFQAVVAVLALSLGPQAIQTVFDRYYYSFRAVSVPEGLKLANGSNKWNITVANASKRLRPLETIIYPKLAGNGIAYARVDTSNDGGLNLTSALLKDNALFIEADRIGPNREFIIHLIFLEADVPQFHTKIGSLHPEVDYRDYRGYPEKGTEIATAHTRLMMLLLNFLVATAIIVAHMIYLGVSTVLRS